MRLRTLELENFKNYAKLSVDLSGIDQLILVGNNAQGKTNFLEAIMVLALSRPHQSLALKDMVNWFVHERETGLPEFLRIKGNVQSANVNNDLEVVCERKLRARKSLKVDGVVLKPHDYVGHLRAVMFTPQDLNMVMLSPQLRRRAINILISQIDREYLRSLSQYQLVLKQRNRLLEHLRDGQGDTTQLDYWDDVVADHGALLLWKRREIFHQLNASLAKHYESISSTAVNFQLSWKRHWQGVDFREMRAVFSDYLRSKRARDIETGKTCGGPHRDDFVFLMNDRDLALSGSRGECRSAVLALKLAECSLIKSITGESPVLLFDDVFSELDPTRQRNLLQLFDVDQVIITTTHLDFSPEKAVVWRVEGGEIASLGSQ